MRSRDGRAWDFLGAEARLITGIFSLVNHHVILPKIVDIAIVYLCRLPTIN